jgi:hypothetical protein
MEAFPKDDFGYWIDTNPEELSLSQTEQVDKDMMIFINSWKLKNFFANKIIWKSDRFSHF